MSSIQDKIYSSMPLPLQNLMISAYGYAWHNRRFGGIFKNELKKFKIRESFSTQQWRQYQTIELRKLLCHAYKTVPFYREKYSKAGYKLLDFQKFELEGLHKLPSLEKDELRMFGTSKILSSTKESKGSFFASSGSTGTPTKILFSHPMHQRWSAAFEARIRNWAGLTNKSSRGMIGGRRVIPSGNAKAPYYRYNFIEKQIYFSAYHISANTALDYAQAINRFNPEYMTGYAMSNYFLAQFFNEKQIQVPQLKAVITSSEKLTIEMRQLFQRVYGCKTFDSYSGVEACGLISENEYGQLLISPDVGIMEVLKEDGSYCKPGEAGEIFSTGLLNFDQPLIRYRIGDIVTLAKDQIAKCGRKMPVIDEIMGRVEDTVFGEDGRKIVRFHGVFVDLPSVNEGQIIQHGIGEFEIKIVCNKSISPDEIKKIKSRMESQLGKIKLEINQVNEIMRNANGKFRAVISNIKRIS